MPGGAFGATPLIVAVEQANHELVELLLAAGANINQRSHWWAGGFHALEDDHAEHGDYAGVLELLLEAGATAPPLTADVKASEAVLAVLRRRTSA
jgi:ankyrin repeat protein